MIEIARLCSLLRAIIMRINSIESRRKYFQKVYNYLLRLYGKMSCIDLITIDETMYVIVSIKGPSCSTVDRYAIAPNGRVYRLKGSKGQPRLVELNDVDEIQAMRRVEEYILGEAKKLANHLGINVEKILNPPKKPRAPSQRRRKQKKSDQAG